MIKRVTDRRHLNAFIFSLIPYIAFFALYILLIDDTDSFSNKKLLEKEKRIKVSLMEITISKVEKKVEQKKEIKKKINKTIEKKPIVVTDKEKRYQKKENKIESEPKSLKVIKDEQIKQRDILIVNNSKKEKKVRELFLKQNLFLVKLRETISSNKTYPKTARRRNIQGDVKVAFNILKNGKVKKIEILEGTSVFHNSVHNAIEKSFPLPVDEELFDFPKKVTLTMSFILSN